MPRCLSLAAILFLSAAATAQPPKPATPTSADSRLVVELFAAAPDIVQPIALDFDAKGRLLVVESHTHFRPAKYDGPRCDRIRMFEDTDGDGKADTITTFYEGTTFTMDLAVHPDGSVYVATRNEIIRLRDTNGDGKADEKTRIVFLDTKGNYPHNGLSGLSFDFHGDLTFGIGENLGADYKLTGSDGTTLTGGGEGGNVYHCTADGKKLRRVATGFWNPFGSCRDIYGRLFVVDNDPDASPPCRLLHVVEGGDYGFQFRYGRQGRHPFQAWNGELPGTLPYVTGTGESPCEVVSYESDGLPKDYLGNLLVPAWADHRVERYVSRQNGASVKADRRPFIQGGKDFYPSGLTVAPDGSLFMSDWGSRSYELHGKGAIWHIKWKDAKQEKRPDDPKKAILNGERKTRETAARVLAEDEAGRTFLRDLFSSKDVRVRATVLAAVSDSIPVQILTTAAQSDPYIGIREMAIRALVARGENITAFLSEKVPPSVRAEAIAGLNGEAAESNLQKLVSSNDPFLRHAAIRRLSQLPELLTKIDFTSIKNEKQRIGVILAWERSGLKDATKHLATFLKDPDPDVRFLAAKWVSDEKLTQFRPQIVEALKSPNLDPRAVVAYTTALARLDGKPVNDDALAAYFLERLADKDATVVTKMMALRSIPATHKGLKTEQLTEMLKQDDPTFRIEALRALKDRGDAKAAATVREIVKDAKQSVVVRAQAIVTLAAIAPPDTALLKEIATGSDPILAAEAQRAMPNRTIPKAIRPEVKDTEAWLKYLEGKADPEVGRRIFENAKVANCSKCHRVDGRGANIGPDLSLIGRTERKWIVESILQPSAVVAPHFQTWRIQTVDDRTLTGLLIGTYLDVSEYIDDKGNRFKVAAGDVADVKALRTSIMPDGLLDGLTDQEIRDLVAFLATRK